MAIELTPLLAVPSKLPYPKDAKQLYTGRVIGFIQLKRRLKAKTTGSLITRKRWKCLCKACGSELIVPQYYFLRPNPKTHCGCRAHTLKSTYKQECSSWRMMQVRCYSPKHIAYPDYGGRGIRVCDEWRDKAMGFEAFLNHIGKAPGPTHTVDRIEVDGHYQPGNVRWATPKEQGLNKRIHKYLKKKPLTAQKKQA